MYKGVDSKWQIFTPTDACGPPPISYGISYVRNWRTTQVLTVVIGKSPSGKVVTIRVLPGQHNELEIEVDGNHAVDFFLRQQFNSCDPLLPLMTPI